MKFPENDTNIVAQESALVRADDTEDFGSMDDIGIEDGVELARRRQISRLVDSLRLVRAHGRETAVGRRAVRAFCDTVNHLQTEVTANHPQTEVME